MRTFIQSLPKAELHVHLEGTLEPELAFALATRNGITLEHKTPAELLAAYDFDDLASFLKIYYAGMRVLQSEEDFYDLTYAYFKRAAQDNIVYVEPFFDPQAHTARGVAFATVINGIHAAQLDAEREFNIRSNLIMCFLRDMSAESAAEHLEMAKPFKDWIVGVGLDSDEQGNPPIKFKKVFSDARDFGWKLTMHCDVSQKDSVENIRQCLEEIAVDRIDHGVSLIEDDKLCAQAIQKGIGLTICPISNVFVSQNMYAKETKALLAKGVKVTVNSDDPAYFRAYLVDNLVALQEASDLSKDEIRLLVANAFDLAWERPSPSVITMHSIAQRLVEAVGLSI